ncbi:MAG: agmatine deiminase family protein [Oscillatoriales cyanobacterium SM2_1_8]|nr:agmatine deiminase family protein [Oscillatoriales cyanobacterium SM2_1_8]
MRSQPAEWALHGGVWTAFPWDAQEWGSALAAAQQEVAAFVRELSRWEPVHLLAMPAVADLAKSHIGEGVHHPVHYEDIPYGDIWLRDTGPLFVKAEVGRQALRFGWNGWGGKYLLAHDGQVGAAIAQRTQTPWTEHPLVVEGGALETDGQGTFLTTERCLLGGDRNPDWTRSQVEAVLAEQLGAQRVHWLTGSLHNDHTDGHIDTLARFAAPGLVLCAQGEADDPNQGTLVEVAKQLRACPEFTVQTVPSPGTIAQNGRLLPASYLNFYIANGAVLVPTYGSDRDGEAVAAIQGCFPERQAIGLSAKAILSGGGAFHCITQQQPVIG